MLGSMTRITLTHHRDHLNVSAFEGPLKCIAICFLNIPGQGIGSVRWILSIIAFFGLLIKASHSETICFTTMYNCEMIDVRCQVRLERNPLTTRWATFKYTYGWMWSYREVYMSLDWMAMEQG